MSVSLICPYDRHLLLERGAQLSCAGCGRHYAVQDGVVCALDQSSDFYEGAYENEVRFLPRSERPLHTWPLWLINSGYVWAVRRLVAPGATVVELGCAGGVRYFGRRYRMVGCDLSLASLKRADSYDRRVRTDAAVCIPLPDSSADAVVCSYFWEHIPPQTKPRILAECRRILKPGGKLVFLYDVETENPLIMRYKRAYSSFYQRLFIDGDGHLGYELPAANLATFEGAGFRVVEHHGMEKTWLQSPSCYAKLSQFSEVGRRMFGWSGILQRFPWFHLFTALIRIVDTMVCPWLPREWARIDMVVCEKPSP